MWLLSLYPFPPRVSFSFQEWTECVECLTGFLRLSVAFQKFDWENTSKFAVHRRSTERESIRSLTFACDRFGLFGTCAHLRGARSGIVGSTVHMSGGGGGVGQEEVNLYVRQCHCEHLHEYRRLGTFPQCSYFLAFLTAARKRSLFSAPVSSV